MYHRTSLQAANQRPSTIVSCRDILFTDCEMIGVRCEMWDVRSESVRCEMWDVRCEYCLFVFSPQWSVGTAAPLHHTAFISLKKSRSSTGRPTNYFSRLPSLPQTTDYRPVYTLQQSIYVLVYYIILFLFLLLLLSVEVPSLVWYKDTNILTCQGLRIDIISKVELLWSCTWYS